MEIILAQLQKNSVDIQKSIVSLMGEISYDYSNAHLFMFVSAFGSHLDRLNAETLGLILSLKSIVQGRLENEKINSQLLELILRIFYLKEKIVESNRESILSSIIFLSN